MLTLLDTDGRSPLYINDNNPLEPPASRIDWSPLAPGEYFVLVYQKYPAVGGCDVTYALEVTGRIPTKTPSPTGTPTSTGTPTPTATPPTVHNAFLPWVARDR